MPQTKQSRRGFFGRTAAAAAAAWSVPCILSSAAGKSCASGDDKSAAGGGLKVRVPVDEVAAAVKGRKAGLLTNATVWLEEVGDDMAGLVKRSAEKTILLAAEHGVRGDGGTGKPEPCTYDSYAGCETRTLYEYYVEKRNPDIIADVDVLVVGMNDIGCRHYTYKATMCHMMASAAKLGKPVIVVDMPNPVRGDVVEGNYPVSDYYKKYFNVTDYLWLAAPITYRHGMTIGEMALLGKDHLKLDLDLRVIKLQGWRRHMWWDDTGRPYISMDPSIYTAETTLGFLCTGLFQGANVSWGIGTADPFRVIGAPWINDDRLLRALRRRNLAGVTWSRAMFTPRWRQPNSGMWSMYAYEPCNGVRLHFTDRNAVRTAEVQLSLLVELCRLYPEKFEMNGRDFDRRLEDPQWPERLKAGEGVDTILTEWEAMSKKFEEIRKPYLLYS